MPPEEDIGRATNEDRAAALAAEQAAFDGVFSLESSDEVEPQGDGAVENNQQVDEQEQTDSTDQTAEVPPESTIAGMSQAQFAELMRHASRVPELEKQLRDANGRYGGLKQTFDDLQKSVSGKPVVDEKKLAEFRALFPDMADYIIDLLPGSAMATAPALSQEEIDKKISDGVQERLSKYEAEQEKKREARAIEQVLKRHGDFWEVKETPKFKEWLSNLPHKEAIKLGTSEDPEYVADQLDKFKASLVDATTHNKQRQQIQRQQRIERAVDPERAKAPPQRTEAQSEQEAFDAVFKNKKR